MVNVDGLELKTERLCWNMHKQLYSGYVSEDTLKELIRFKEAVLWLYNQQGHDLCHENIKDLFARCGLPPKELGLPPREEFRERCMKYEEEVYTDNMTESKDGH